MATRRQPDAKRHEDVLESLRAIAEERVRIIDETREERRRLDESVRRRHDEMRELRRNANRVLVQAIDAAQAEGLRKEEICRRIGMSTQNASQMRLGVERWDTKKSESS